MKLVAITIGLFLPLIGTAFTIQNKTDSGVYLLMEYKSFQNKKSEMFICTPELPLIFSHHVLKFHLESLCEANTLNNTQFVNIAAITAGDHHMYFCKLKKNLTNHSKIIFSPKGDYDYQCNIKG